MLRKFFLVKLVKEKFYKRNSVIVCSFPKYFRTDMVSEIELKKKRQRNNFSSQFLQLELSVIEQIFFLRKADFVTMENNKSFLTHQVVATFGFPNKCDVTTQISIM